MLKLKRLPPYHATPARTKSCARNPDGDESSNHHRSMRRKSSFDSQTAAAASETPFASSAPEPSYANSSAWPTQKWGSRRAGTRAPTGPT